MGGAWDSVHSRVYDTLERESPGKEANRLQAVPTQLILDTHTSGLHWLFSCQDPGCGFYIAGTTGLWAGISGKPSCLLLRWCVKEERARFSQQKHLALHLLAV